MELKTLVFVHAHPDDEALLTAGTMAKASSQGHRVVLIVATDGAAGLASAHYSENLAATRAHELEVSAAALGVARVVNLGFADSGLDGKTPHSFSQVPVVDVADLIAAVVNEEQAEILVGYDRSGGYGHPDHVHVHRAARTAAQLSSRDLDLYEATLPREPIANAVKLAERLHLTPSSFNASEFANAWTPRRDITHRIDVSSTMQAKVASLRAHASQASADGTVRTIAVLTRLPAPLRNVLLGTEYYVRVSEASQRANA
jgi:LmbE family N-acetylglucosaminyl deacetylase